MDAVTNPMQALDFVRSQGQKTLERMLARSYSDVHRIQRDAYKLEPADFSNNPNLIRLDTLSPTVQGRYFDQVS